MGTIELTSAVYEVPGFPGCWGYTVDSSQGHAIKQEFVPGAPGWAVMTEATATEYAALTVQELQAL
jgi:hypothetical protein